MSIDFIKKTRGILLLATGIIIFIGAQIFPAADTKEVQSFFEAFGMAGIICILNLVMWSDWMHNRIKEDGLNINYKQYQAIGLSVVFGIFMIMVEVYILQEL